MVYGMLTGLRVLELADGLGAAYCGRLLADAGAEVIAVEPPAGSAVRRMGPFVHDQPGAERGLPWLHAALNKRSVTLDLAGSDGRALFLQLLARADALVEDAPPGQLDALGLDDAAVAAARPGLVWTSVTAFGQSGPYRDLPASALTLQALSGWLGLSGTPDRPPVQVGGRVAELVPGLIAAIATLGELLDMEPDHEPRPRRVDVSSLEMMTALHPPFEMGYSYFGRGPVKRNGNRIASTYPFTVMPCKDGHAAVVHLTHAQWELICQLMGMERFLEDPDLQTPAGRVLNADRIEAAMRPWLAERTMDEVFHEGQSWRIPFAKVMDAADIAASPQIEARGWLAPVEHREAGRYRVPTAPYQITGIERTPERSAPALGQDNPALYGELGLNSRQLSALREAGVI